LALLTLKLRLLLAPLPRLKAFLGAGFPYKLATVKL
jgi:hypothetical protein